MEMDCRIDIAKKGISRRSLLIGGAAASLAAASAALTGCAPSTGKPELSATGASNADTNWDEEFDIVVVGGGGAGASAAIIAHDAGSSVVVLEKGEMLGGSTALCGQAIIGVDTKVQREAGITDSVDEALKYYMAAGDGDEELMRAMLEESGPAVDWLIDLGMQVPATISNPGLTKGGQEDAFAEIAAPIARTHWSVTPQPGLWPVLAQAMEKRGIDTRTKFPVVGLIRDDASGEIRGVVAMDGNTEVRIAAKKAVILCAGGFSRNCEMKQRLISKHPIASHANIYDTGDGMNLGLSVGCDVGWFGFLKNITYVRPEEPEASLGAVTLAISGSENFEGNPPFILVNTSGKRFTNERKFYSLICEDLQQELEGKCFAISCGAYAEAALPYVIQAESISDLANAIEVEPDILESTINEWNEACSANADTAFGRSQDLLPILEAPYVAVEVRPGTGTSFGGVIVDTNARAIDSLTKEPISRLYACGNNGSFLGRYYPSCGAAVCSAVTSGRIAGRDAAALESWS
ncbi:FAD-dependent oxidoreductase [Adlercreutzia shanghongiae]|uniref:FAD-dependent oxidoreductase n=1 Tax=Adlercreutzia shanghongiae TaxID=3111773 RepID=A0ABU6IZ35_9ACTN|nr:FAD-dependent oxidoreductase [Adlercreutzia sp. R22]MEC4294931.1 FAD-dependent oxidoreductase [Adlercreutzia sp. R22]